jgi:hypothetical protein
MTQHISCHIDSAHTHRRELAVECLRGRMRSVVVRVVRCRPLCRQFAHVRRHPVQFVYFEHVERERCAVLYDDTELLHLRRGDTRVITAASTAH